MQSKTFASRATFVLLPFLLILSMACGMLDSLSSTITGTTSGTVANLWSDVPPMQGATKADLGMPMLVQLAIKSVSQGRFEFIAFTTERSGDDVANYYSKDAMKAAGWDTPDLPGCTSGMIGGSNQQQGGAFCVFGRKEDGKDIRLVIVALADDKTKKTQIYYARIDTTTTATPAK